MTLVFFLVFLLISERPFAQHIQRPIPQSIQPILDKTTEPRSNGSIAVLRRQEIPLEKTCGFYEGDASKPRTADPGFACRVDTKNGIWGFCPTTVIAATDCGLAGACFDASDCTSGCGISDDSTITTISCTERNKSFCSFAILTAGPDQVYSYIACGGKAVRDNLLAAATTTPQKTVTSSATPTALPPSSLPKSSSTLASSTATRSSRGSSDLVPTPSLTSTSTSTPTSARTTQSTLSSSTSSALSITLAKTESTPPPVRDHMGAIIGGIIGGIALICVTVLGVFYLRKYRRDHPPPPSAEPEIAKLPMYNNTHAQTAGLFEKDSKLPEIEMYAGPQWDGKRRSNAAVELPS